MPLLRPPKDKTPQSQKRQAAQKAGRTSRWEVPGLFCSNEVSSYVEIAVFPPESLLELVNSYSARGVALLACPAREH